MSTVTVAQICEALRQRHEPQAWIFATEVPTSTGYGPRARWDKIRSMRRIDAFAMALWPSLGYKRIAYEIKIRRGDWLEELKNPVKRMQAYLLSNEFYFVLGPGIYDKEDWKLLIGEQCGIMEIGADSKIKVIHRVRSRRAWPMPEGFVASFLRRVRDEAKGGIFGGTGASRSAQ